MRTDVLGIGFDNLTMDDAVSRAYGMLGGTKAVYAVTPNPEIVWQCRKDAKLSQAVSGASLVLPDGIGVVYGAKILGRPLKEKIAGIDFASLLFKKMACAGQSVFLLGAKPGVAEAAAERLTEKYPGLVIAGTSDGYFKDDAPVIDKINKASPDLLLVCLGAPKQEYWMADNAGKLNVKLMAGLGGSLDVFAGTVARAPESWQKLGLEWLYRLLKEPRRIKRMIKLPLFILAVTGQRIRGK
jgi:N-acetylglucosaminyldiphosphoundecaprenol N-acetyl-beta-D-mannosaminyltransferase